MCFEFASVFLQLNLSLTDSDTKKIQRIIGFGNPTLFGTLNGKVNVQIDGTFKIVPNPFYQCLIIMVFDVQTSVYVPVIYVLMTGKSENMYWHALHWVYVCSNWKLDPFSVTCDFEAGLQKAVIGQFPDAILNDCLFYWKQAI